VNRVLANILIPGSFVQLGRNIEKIVEQNNFIKEYYKRLSDTVALFEWESFVKMAAAKSSYIFTHMINDIQIKYIDDIASILGPEKYKKFISEGSKTHFGKTGNKWQAEFIYNKLLNKGLIE
jgi:hypothetical protein